MISVVIPAYNYADYLPAAIDSVLAQGIEDIEILVCDDASTDNTPEVIARYEAAHPSVHGYRNLVNLGAVININYAVSLAHGDYILVLGADDYLAPGALAHLKAALDDHPECGYAFGRYNIEVGNGQIAALTHPGWLDHGYAGTRDEFAPLLRHDCYINIGATLFRRASVKLRESFFDVLLRTFEGERFFRATDWDLVLFLSLNNVTGVFLNEQISIFRQHQHQASSVDKYGASGVAITEHMLLLDRYLTDENLPRLTGQLGPIFALLYGKFLFYTQHAKPASQQIDDYIRRRFSAYCERFKTLLRLDPSSSVPPVLQGVLEAGRALHFPVAEAQNIGPLFSVVLTTYQRPALLQNALASVLAQSCQDFEILLVNDGGPMVESTLDWVGRDARVTYLRQPNRGPSAARNAALKLARGRYIVYLDDDDLMRPKHLETLKEQLQLTPDAVVYTTAEYVTESLEGGLRIERKRFIPYAHDEFDKLRLQVCNYIPINTFCHARALLDHVGLFDESLHALEDWDLLIRLSRVVPFVHIQRNTVEVRQRLEDRSGHQTGRQFDNLHDLFRKIYARYDDLGEPAVRVGRAAILAAEHPIQASLGSMSYQAWLGDHGLREVDAEILAERMMSKWHRRPLITIVMKVPQARLDALGGTIQSLQQQLYNTWRLVVVADFPAPDPIFNSTDLLGWLQVDRLDDADVLAQALNAIVTDLPGDWIGFLPSGSELAPDCLLRVADYVQHKDKLVAVYSDHDTMLLPGCYAEPQFKPDINLEYLLNWDYIEAACWFNQQSVMSVGGFAAFPGKEGYELLLRLIDQFGADNVGHLAYPLAHLPQQQETDLSRAAHRVAVMNHLARQGREKSQVLEGALPDTFKVAYEIDGTPLVSIVIPSRDKLEFLQPCVETLLGKTRYQQFEILIVDNQSVDPDVLDYYREIQEREPERVRVVEYDAPFNFSAQCNLGVSVAKGDYVLLLNNDIEIVQPEWLERMLMHAQRPEVGMVGAKLVYPETGMVQHGGIVLGGGPMLLDVATHFGMECKLDDPGYMNRNQCDMYLSGLTAACLLMRREVYTEVGGMNEELSVLFNDVEFCLRMGQAGYKLLWTPYAVLVHHHGMSVNDKLKNPIEQGRFAERSQREHEYMLDNWLPALANDPAYNRNLTLQGAPLTIEPAVPFTWDPSFTERPKILATAIPGGSGEYRVIEPLVALAVAGKAQVCTVRAVNSGNRTLKLSEIERMNPDVLVTQNGISDHHLETLRYYQKYFADKRRVVTLDDLLTDLPEKSSQYKHIKANFRDARRRLRTCLSMADRLVVSTAPLAEFARDFIDDIQVVPNRVSKAKWQHLASARGVGRKPRVGWVGALQHKGDLELIKEVVRATADEVEWVFMGMWPEDVDDCIREKRQGVPFKNYPQAVASMNLDLAVAPLEINAFNESKSNLRLLEYGVLGWPVVASDIIPYQTNDAPVKRVPNTPEAWIEAIRERVHDLDATYREGDALRAWVTQHYLLEDHLDEWVRAYGK